MDHSTQLIDPFCDRLCKAEEVAELLGVDIKTLIRWRKTNPAFPKPIKLIPGRTNGPIRYRLSAIRLFLERCDLQSPTREDNRASQEIASQNQASSSLSVRVVNTQNEADGDTTR